MELDFRIYDTKREMYLPGGELVFALYGDAALSIIPNAQEYIGVETKDSDFIIEQFSGKIDRNDKRVFVGDVIKSTYYNYSGKNCELIQEVYFGDGCFCARTLGRNQPIEELDRNNSPLFWLNAPSYMEIIGNTHL